MRLTIGFSPCPNDTFIFDALINGRIDSEGLVFEPVIEDVEALNRRAMAGELDVTKLSFHAFSHLTDIYALLDAGSALGRNCGPLLVARSPMNDVEVAQARIAIPGEWTTANFLFSLVWPEARDKTPLLFSEIEDAVLRGDFDAGLIIHENRFTYASKGLVKIRDLGEYWEGRTGSPIPLGGIVARRDLPAAALQTINRAIGRSVAYAFAHPDESMPYVRRYAQSMDDAVMRRHIGLYVNEFSRSLGDEGRAAVRRLFDEACLRGVIERYRADLFV
ncbi:MAG: 1,4-dihydroxy-6-naphthoate synthase [Saprospiraceae bacterium]